MDEVVRQQRGNGALAEYAAVPENLLALKPANLSFEEAASVPMAAVTALQGLRDKGEIRPGQKVLINGASGGVGTFAVQIAKSYGAEVTAVCSTQKMDLVRSLGADQVIDYTQEDFTQNGETYDLIFDIMNKSSFEKCKNSLTPNGVYLLASFKMKQIFQMLQTSRSSGRKVICALAMENLEDMELTRKLVEERKIKAIVDKRFPMERAVEAHRYVESGNKAGSVVITICHSG